MNTEPFRKPLVLLVRMRSKLVVLLVSLHFQKVRTNELLLLMKWTWGWWILIFAILSKVMLSIFFIFTPFFPTKEIIFLFHLGNIICRTVDKNVGAGIDTLMSISDGLGPSIFCQKMEKARPMREVMDGKVVYFPPESAFLPLMLYF